MTDRRKLKTYLWRLLVHLWVSTAVRGNRAAGRGTLHLHRRGTRDCRDNRDSRRGTLGTRHAAAAVDYRAESRAVAGCRSAAAAAVAGSAVADLVADSGCDGTECAERVYPRPDAFPPAPANDDHLRASASNRVNLENEN